MDIKAAEQLVVTWAKEYRHELGLQGSNIEASYIWNPGGFVNQSYRLSDGETIRHVKFVQERKTPHLQQWALLSDHLTDRYHAPRLVQEVTQEVLPGYPYGLVFEFIDGMPLSAITDPTPMIPKVLRMLHQLHNDSQIQDVIASECVLSYAEALAEEYITRFEEDLEGIRAERHLLTFVTDQTLGWFDAELAVLRQLAQEMPCFQKQATDVVHNDINWQNILANDNHDLWLIDWDDLTVTGDAAMDYSVLLWPLYRKPEWPFWQEQVIGLAGKEVYERMELYFRFKLFDDVVDVLADFVEAETMTDVKEKTQKRAKEIHLRAYPEYLELYGSV
ncbi:aminoglycoside phosphotransferase family protein [Paenibacillus mendelii]|uniref:Aminoglycoside phosphotransferase family protein n=1 Tax=Paenibacillus mendelii TaxID=206163 RepID=A0ABV6J493_9BACL|nr:aminoglycoside phosphotransferase family protein [Paenibacillus mendelii]MCQ6561778.1 aminoglycoside phosphotransferase family protein [Paenibacillus mendelii]